MNGRQRLKLYISIVIASLAIASLVLVAVLKFLTAGEEVGFDTVDIGAAIAAIVVVYKFIPNEPKGGGHDKS